MESKLGELELSQDGKKAEIKINDNFDLKLYLGESLTNVSTITSEEKQIVACFDSEKVKLEISLEEHDGCNFYNFQWFHDGKLQYLKDTLYLGDLNETQWYGGPDVLQQTFPLLKSDSSNVGYDFCPYLVLDPYLKPASGHERYWVSSAKVGLFVPSKIPLWTKLSSNGYLSLQAQFDSSPYQSFKVVFVR